MQGGQALQWTKQNVIRFQRDDPDIVQMAKWMQHDILKTCPHTASITLREPLVPEFFTGHGRMLQRMVRIAACNWSYPR